MHLRRIIFALILATTSIAHAGNQPVSHRAPARISGSPLAAAVYPFAAPVVLASPTMI
jgi:DNA-binding transcriptional regulator YbjK